MTVEDEGADKSVPSVSSDMNLPDRVMLLGVIEIVSYMTEDGQDAWSMIVKGSERYTTLVGLLEMAKIALQKEILERYEK
jgi:hypothetical protein